MNTNSNLSPTLKLAPNFVQPLVIMVYGGAAMQDRLEEELDTLCMPYSTHWYDFPGGWSEPSLEDMMLMASNAGLIIIDTDFLFEHAEILPTSWIACVGALIKHPRACFIANNNSSDWYLLSNRRVFPDRDLLIKYILPDAGDLYA